MKLSNKLTLAAVLQATIAIPNSSSADSEAIQQLKTGQAA